MAAPTNYDLQYDDYCDTYGSYDCELPSVCPDSTSYSPNRRVFCRDVTVLDDLTVDMMTETKNLKVVDDTIEIGEIKYVVGQVSGGGSTFFTLVVDPSDEESMAKAEEKAKVMIVL